MPEDSQRLDHLRSEVDQVDASILGLLKKRAHLSQQIFQAKKGVAIYRPERETQLLSRLIQFNESALSDQNIRSIFTEIISSCRALQRPLRLAFLGPAGTFTHEAACKHFGSEVEMISQESIFEVFENAKKNTTDYGVVPIENSQQGGVHATLEALERSSLYICSEIELPITHHLIGHSADLSAIKKIVSHPQALLQCKHWLRKHLPNTLQDKVASTSLAIQSASADPAIAAIGSSMGANVFEIPIIKHQINDAPDNITRFIVLGKKQGQPSGCDKTSLFLQLSDQVGALSEVLECFRNCSVNLKKIESYPAKREKWMYVFFIDIEGHYQDANVSKALEFIKSVTMRLKVLGSYPAAFNSK